MLVFCSDCFWLCVVRLGLVVRVVDACFVFFVCFVGCWFRSCCCFVFVVVCLFIDVVIVDCVCVAVYCLILLLFA